MESLHSHVYQFGKLFQICKVATEELFREDRVNDLFSLENGSKFGLLQIVVMSYMQNIYDKLLSDPTRIVLNYKNVV